MYDIGFELDTLCVIIIVYTFIYVHYLYIDEVPLGVREN